MNYVIFNSVYSVIMLCAVVTLYVLTAFAVRFSKDKLSRIFATANIAVHILFALLLFFLKATVEEMLFILVVSVVFSLVVRLLKGEK